MRKMPKNPVKPVFLTILRIIILPFHYFIQEVNQSHCIDLLSFLIIEISEGKVFIHFLAILFLLIGKERSIFKAIVFKYIVPEIEYHLTHQRISRNDVGFSSVSLAFLDGLQKK